MTYLAEGLALWSVRSENVNAIPVADGIIIKSLDRLPYPNIFKADLTRLLVSFSKRDDPAALGCSASSYPERPIPWARWKCQSATRDEYIRPSLSPTPQLSGELFLIIKLFSWELTNPLMPDLEEKFW